MSLINNDCLIKVLHEIYLFNKVFFNKLFLFFPFLTVMPLRDNKEINSVKEDIKII